MEESFRSYADRVVPAVDRALAAVLPSAETPPRRLHEAMRYAVFAGGKRVRPLLVMLASSVYSDTPVEGVEAVAASLELIHVFSLVHDDLPALDDDDLRRGKPTLHRRYDEALAVLAGDALLNLAFETLCREPSASAAELRLANVRTACQAVGSAGMIGGQVADLEAEEQGERRRARGGEQEQELRSIHRRKTGALLSAALEIGARTGGASADDLETMRRLGDRLGLLFQIRDDLLDRSGTAEELGKTPGKDARSGKLTYPLVFGLDQSVRIADEVAEQALALAAELPRESSRFTALIAYLRSRRS